MITTTFGESLIWGELYFGPTKKRVCYFLWDFLRNLFLFCVIIISLHLYYILTTQSFLGKNGLEQIIYTTSILWNPLSNGFPVWVMVIGHWQDSNINGSAQNRERKNGAQFLFLGNIFHLDWWTPCSLLKQYTNSFYFTCKLLRTACRAH